MKTCALSPPSHRGRASIRGAAGAFVAFWGLVVGGGVPHAWAAPRFVEVTGTVDGGGTPAMSPFTSSESLRFTSFHTVGQAAADAGVAGGGRFVAGSGFAYTVDVTPPERPLLEPVSVALPIRGEAEINTRVRILVDGAEPGGVLSRGTDGRAFSFSPSAAFGPGSHRLTATATDGQGNRSLPARDRSFALQTASGVSQTRRAGHEGPDLQGGEEQNFVVSIEPGGEAEFEIAVEGTGHVTVLLWIDRAVGDDPFPTLELSGFGGTSDLIQGVATDFVENGWREFRVDGDPSTEDPRILRLQIHVGQTAGELFVDDVVVSQGQ